MCKGKCDCKSKKIPRQAYTATITEFNGMKGLLCPIYADIVIGDLSARKTEDGSTLVNKVLNIMNGHESCTNKVVGYFAALPNSNPAIDSKFTVAMSFCVPMDYPQFDHTFAKFWAMRKAIKGNNLLAHCTKAQQVIFSDKDRSPIYYFGYGNTIQHQFVNFSEWCKNYYSK